jgi:hypothetical protein
MKGWQILKPEGPCDPNKDTEECARYGGFKDANLCKTAFPGDSAAQKACTDVLYGVFPSPEGPTFPGNIQVVSSKPIKCPAEFHKMSGV